VTLHDLPHLAEERANWPGHWLLLLAVVAGVASSAAEWAAAGDFRGWPDAAGAAARVVGVGARIAILAHCTAALVHMRALPSSAPQSLPSAAQHSAAASLGLFPTPHAYSQSPAKHSGAGSPPSSLISRHTEPHPLFAGDGGGGESNMGSGTPLEMGAGLVWGRARSRCAATPPPQLRLQDSSASQLWPPPRREATSRSAAALPRPQAAAAVASSLHSDAPPSGRGWEPHASLHRPPPRDGPAAAAAAAAAEAMEGLVAFDWYIAGRARDHSRLRSEQAQADAEAIRAMNSVEPQLSESAPSFKDTPRTAPPQQGPRDSCTSHGCGLASRGTPSPGGPAVSPAAARHPGGGGGAQG
jgi:hypothetical protein